MGGVALISLALAVMHMGNHRPLAPEKCESPTQCFHATEQMTFPDYGNSYPSNLPDCLFAAAANWQSVVLHTTPREALVEREYILAAAHSGRGVSESQFIEWWRTHGIGNVVVRGWTDVNFSQRSDVTSALRTHRALFAVFTFSRNATIGGARVEAGRHAAILDGYSPTGPYVVTWGHTYQMTWREFSSSVNSLRFINR